MFLLCISCVGDETFDDQTQAANEEKEKRAMQAKVGLQFVI